ncbi:MAG: transposase family protein [Nitrospirales bacterium]|nr:transposase family protein [Nitrospirales bacterium]
MHRDRKKQEGQGDTLFQAREISVMIVGCQRDRACWTHTDSPGFVQGPIKGIFGDPPARVIRLARRQKNGVRPVWTSHQSFYDRKVRRIRDLSCGERRIYLEVEVRRVRCRRCGTVKQEKVLWLADNPFYTKRFAWYVGAAAEVPPSRMWPRSSSQTGRR